MKFFLYHSSFCKFSAVCVCVWVCVSIGGGGGGQETWLGGRGTWNMSFQMSHRGTYTNVDRVVVRGWREATRPEGRFHQLPELFARGSVGQLSILFRPTSPNHGRSSEACAVFQKHLLWSFQMVCRARSFVVFSNFGRIICNFIGYRLLETMIARTRWPWVLKWSFICPLGTFMGTEHFPRVVYHTHTYLCSPTK